MSPPSPRDSALDATAIVLAGGLSTRLGRDKASEPLLGVPLLARVVERVAEVAADVIIVRAGGQRLPEVPGHTARVVEDLEAGRGPLGGIRTGLEVARSPYAVVVACDMPLLQPPLLRELLRRAPGHEAVVPLQRGRPQPLCAVYSRDCLEALRSRLVRGLLRVVDALEDLDVLYLDERDWVLSDPEGFSFLNLNREEDLARARALIAAGY